MRPQLRCKQSEEHGVQNRIQQNAFDNFPKIRFFVIEDLHGRNKDEIGEYNQMHSIKLYKKGDCRGPESALELEIAL